MLFPLLSSQQILHHIPWSTHNEEKKGANKSPESLLNVNLIMTLSYWPQGSPLESGLFQARKGALEWLYRLSDIFTLHQEVWRNSRHAPLPEPLSERRTQRRWTQARPVHISISRTPSSLENALVRVKRFALAVCPPLECLQQTISPPPGSFSCVQLLSVGRIALTLIFSLFDPVLLSHLFVALWHRQTHLLTIFFCTLKGHFETYPEKPNLVSTVTPTQ